MKRWLLPKLIVLRRCSENENLLAACKASQTVVLSQATRYYNCRYDSTVWNTTCYGCSMESYS
jgi:hypothetical protein